MSMYVVCLMYVSVVLNYYLHNKILLLALKCMKYLMRSYGVKKKLCPELRCHKIIIHAVIG